MSVKGQPVIIIKKKKHAHAHHGGAWKVAYADFVTAMMAFFMVLWLVGQNKSVKSAVGGYFRDPVVFDMGGGLGVLPGGNAMETPSTVTVDPESQRQALEAAVNHIRDTINHAPDLEKLKNQIEFSVTAEGLRINLLENDKSSFFDSGSAIPLGETEHILGVIAKELGGLSQDVVVEGHTDSRPYAPSNRSSNWELSVDRANSARRVMERSGLRAAQVISVRGHADRQLRVPEQPLDARNRRVSIVVKNPVTTLADARAHP